jgi:hypothetical protein
MGFSSMQRIEDYSMITSPWKTGAERKAQPAFLAIGLKRLVELNRCAVAVAVRGLLLFVRFGFLLISLSC